jgi:hypothetical protein
VLPVVWSQVPVGPWRPAGRSVPLGARGRNRTDDLPLTRRLLWPTELRGRGRKNTWKETCPGYSPWTGVAIVRPVDGPIWLIRAPPGRSSWARARRSRPERVTRSGQAAWRSGGSTLRCRCRASEFTMRAWLMRLRCWRSWPMLWARRSQRVSSRARLIDSASLRRR